MQCIVSKNVEKQGHLSTRTPTSTTQTLAELRVKCAFGFLRVHVSQTLCWNYFILFYFSLSLFPHLFIFPLLFFFSSQRGEKKRKRIESEESGFSPSLLGFLTLSISLSLLRSQNPNSHSNFLHLSVTLGSHNSRFRSSVWDRSVASPISTFSFQLFFLLVLLFIYFIVIVFLGRIYYFMLHFW